jgi:DNA-binding CsgD family transcriptional regulator
MDDAQRWLAVAAVVLAEPDPPTAEHLLVQTLETWGRAYRSARTGASPAPRLDDVALHPAPDWQDSTLWRDVVTRAALDHPLYAFNVLTRADRPATLAGVVAQGWTLSEGAAHTMLTLGFTPHQMTIPLAPGAGGGRDAYALVSEAPYTDDDVARAGAVQALIAGLDSHVRLLAAAVRHAASAPDPVAVRLTPRERVVLDQIARGSTVEGIAARLAISPRTVHKHQEHLYRKLGAVDRLSAVLSAQRLGLLRSPDR